MFFNVTIRIFCLEKGVKGVSGQKVKGVSGQGVKSELRAETGSINAEGLVQPPAHHDNIVISTASGALVVVVV